MAERKRERPLDDDSDESEPEIRGRRNDLKWTKEVDDKLDRADPPRRRRSGFNGAPRPLHHSTTPPPVQPVGAEATAVEAERVEFDGIIRTALTRTFDAELKPRGHTFPVKFKFNATTGWIASRLPQALRFVSCIICASFFNQANSRVPVSTTHDYESFRMDATSFNRIMWNGWSRRDVLLEDQATRDGSLRVTDVYVMLRNFPPLGAVVTPAQPPPAVDGVVPRRPRTYRYNVEMTVTWERYNLAGEKVLGD